ncbi:MAG: TonB-dependent receptor [Phycisphaerales bacterium]
MVILRGTALVSALAAVAATAPAHAQAAAGGTVRGTVVDKEFSAPVAGAVVTILDTGARATTGDTGAFSLPNIPPGTYTVVVTKPGFLRAVRTGVSVGAGKLVDADFALAGEFEDMEEFVVQDMTVAADTGAQKELLVPINFEPYTILPPIEFRLRLEAPALLDTVGVEAISRSGASDAAAALLLVPGASLQDGKYAVIRGLPDRYVATLMDGVRLPTADPDKRAVKLDQFPTAIIEGIQVSKNFTPDQQGEASGGAVNIQLKDLPEEGYLRISGQVGGNSQVKDGQFLTYPGGGLGFWGGNSTLKTHPDQAGQSWSNPTSTLEGTAPPIFKWSVAAGQSWEIDDGVRLGAFGNFFYAADASAYNNGQLNSLEQAGPGTALVPETFGTGTDFKTELYDVAQGTQSVDWGGLGTIGLETENNRLSVKFLYTLLSENQAIRLTDTRGKSYFFPGYNPDDLTGIGHDQPDAAPWNRLETLDYSQLSTQALILRGEHTLAFLDSGEGSDPGTFAFGVPTLDWRLSLSKAKESQPDQTQFAAYWIPEFQIIPGFNLPPQWIAYPPAQSAFVGWVQHINYENEESSIQGALNVKLPFTQWDDRDGYVKTGTFVDVVSRSYRQQTFSNSGDPNTSNSSGWDQPWSVVFPTQDHPISESTTDISYDGAQDILAFYGMIDLPINETMNIVTGLRYEGTHMSTTVIPDVDALWIDVNTQTLFKFTGPNIWDADFTENRILPMIGWNWSIQDDLVVRLAFAQTLARPNFYEMVPVLQYEYIGGPIFIGNPDLGMSALNNYDARVDYTPYENWLISGSVFYKTIKDPIQYVNRFTEGFSYTSALNFPSGWLLGAEIESRITFEPIFGEAWKGLAVGGNFTWMTSSVQLDQDDIDALRVYGDNSTSQPMTATPDYLFNVNLTYDFEPFGTQFGIFYNYKGESLVSGANPHTTLLTPAIYQLGYGTLNVTLSQQIVGGLKVSASAKNLTNPQIQTQYRMNENITGLNSTYTAGIDFAVALTFQAAF